MQLGGCVVLALVVIPTTVSRLYARVVQPHSPGPWRGWLRGTQTSIERSLFEGEIEIDQLAHGLWEQLTLMSGAGLKLGWQDQAPGSPLVLAVTSVR